MLPSTPRFFISDRTFNMAPIFPLLHKTVVFEFGPISAVLVCLLLALIYVGSLYFWTTGAQP